MDLMFRDQSKETACKAQGIKPKSKPKSSASVNSAALDCRQVSRRSMDSDISASSESLQTWWSTLQVPAEQQAVCFFFSNYVLESSNPSISVYHYLPAFYNNESEKSALSCAVVALGLAGLSYRRNESSLLSAAKSMYSSALHLTNEALRDPATAATDTTLISVLLLGLFEVSLSSLDLSTSAELMLRQTNTCNAPPSMRAWLKHISGATALLELRGKQQLDTEIGRRLFAHLLTQIVNFCILRRKPIPSTVLELSGVCPAIYEGVPTDLATKIMAINAKLCSLRAKIGHRPQTISPITAKSIISEALSIAADLDDWHIDLPQDRFSFTTVKMYSPTPEVYSDYYHVYRDLSSASLVNNSRVILILVHEIILTQLSYIRRQSPQEFNEQSGYNRTSLPSYADQIQRQIKSSQKTILDLIDLICASVPFLLDYEYCASAMPTQSEPLHPRAAGGNAAMWPLYVSAEISFVRNSTREWIIGRLNKIGGEMGVQQANTMVGFLLQRKEVTDVLMEDNDANGEYATTEEREAVLTDRNRLGQRIQ
jgi:hypothetical protein